MSKGMPEYRDIKLQGTVSVLVGAPRAGRKTPKETRAAIAKG